MAPLDTRFTDLLDLDVPIVQAPVGSATCPELAAAVADAGGLGMLAVTWRSPEETRETVRETRRLTDGAFGVNVVMDDDAKAVPTGDHLDACLAAGVDVVSFSFGAGDEHVERVRDAGGVVLQSVGSADAARGAARAGADAVVAQGWEAGGHVESEVATMPLVPRVVDAVDVPVVSAGGIADGRGVAAALTLGADAAWLGTRFLATAEARVHDRYRERVVDAAETDTYYGTLFDEGWPDAPHRVLRNATVDDWEAAGGPPRGERPGEGEVVAEGPDGDPVERYEDSLALPGTTGDVEALPLYAGQSAGLAEEVVSAEDLTAELAAETRAALSRASSGREGDAERSEE
ncbi:MULTISPECIES: nitronate monooxygenase family protein [Halorussus]|uniref:NAD(P)H-dependent flavin oxidoreductase n=1 Tax=Halorussus TaxID=1070314 RepID=UPI000E21A106|nr:MULTISPECIES: nitronate monooxygenase [Halorussus]NHN60899.1 nitronate monooxygenase [Halorussus sp. JP-T4]